MKKNSERCDFKSYRIKNILRIMKISVFLFFTTITSVFANDSYSQDKRLTLNMTNVKLGEVFDVIENNSQFYFLINQDLIDEDRIVSINVKKKRISNILNILLKNKQIEYVIHDKQIVFTKPGHRKLEKTPNMGVTSNGFSTNIETSLVNIKTAQTYTIKGRVTDATEQPLPGVNVLVKNTNVGTQTDFDGNYSLNIPQGASHLVFSYLGQRTQEIAITGQTVINVALEEDTARLDEVVVIGYGTAKRSDLTGSVASISSEDIMEQPNNDIVSSLQGRAAGVQIYTGDSSPGGGISIRVRGTSTITGSTEPLYIIDGFPVSSSNRDINIGGGIGEGQAEGSTVSDVFPNALSMINPADIANIEILKDAAATAIYGSRGANGVIIITTKRGRSGKSKLSVNYSVGVSSLANKLNRLDGNLRGQIDNENEIRDGADPADVRWNGADEFHPIPGNAESFDWQDIVYRQAISQNVSLSFSGGNENTKYLLSANVIDKEGIMRETGFKDYQLRMNLDNAVGSFLNLKSSILLSTSERRQAPGAGSGFGANVVRDILSAHPLINPEWRDPTNPGVWYTDPLRQGSGTFSNPLKLLQDIDDKLIRNRLLGNISATFNLTKSLKLVGNAGIDYSDGTRKIYTKSSLTLSGSVVEGGDARLNTNELVRSNVNAYFAWDNTFNDHNFNAVVGAENTTTTISNVNLSARGFATDDLLTENFSGGNSETFNIINNKNKRDLVGFFGRLNYNYKNKYYVSLNARQDGSSVFGPKNKWGFFPSVALAWKPTEEAFLKNQELISNLKMRVSIGQTGNGDLSPYSSQGLWTIRSDRYSFGGQAVNGVELSRIDNENLKWETTTQYNIGFDARFLNNRYGFSFDYYLKDTEDLILPVVIPETSGFSSSIQNLGTLRNRGLEFSADAVILEGDFHWDINANISFQKVFATDVKGGTNIDLRTGDPYIEVFGFPRRNGPRLYEGQDAGQLYGFVRGGVFADQAEADAAPDQINGNQEGYVWYQDIDGNGSIGDEDQVPLGKITPDYFYGFTNRFSYKSFDLSVFFQGVQGNSIIAFYGGDAGDPREANFWTPDNRITNTPINASVNGTLNSFQTTDRRVQDGSYLRLKNIRLGYTLPQDIGIFGGLNIFLTATNLWTNTDYRGYNPDVSSGGATPFSEGFDTGIYPLAKEVTLGLNFNF
ncbi:TonB-dependent receptor [Flavivirga amylovorans]|uniref:TonB-dependent receptor n=1 Tax=Flavivirga amylovorans TaxID=870486 RepID=A0ABT8WY05_9FLAO|nr:TonB-dependent receptor [Flavivirga amylovorans]MDO5986567.1 TonB-dependent receptor [Flavivirga amylovorans]